MVTVSGRDTVRRFILQTKERIEGPLAKGAALAAGRVVADDAKARSRSDEVAAGIKVRIIEGDAGVAIARIVPAKAAHIARWLEYGTDPHVISADLSQSGGRTARRINQQERDGSGSLVIGGAFVGAKVFHPGARPYPFLRPALDHNEDAARAAAQAYIDTHGSRIGGEDNA